MTQPVDIIDATGHKCPMPVLRLRRALSVAKAESLVELLATDPAARKDVPLFCQQTGHILVRAETGNPDRYLIRCAPNDTQTESQGND
ncbi:MAG: sulfurtransferase TusA [Alphaproteobacteria bacterium]